MAVADGVAVDCSTLRAEDVPEALLDDDHDKMWRLLGQGHRTLLVESQGDHFIQGDRARPARLIGKELQFAEWFAWSKNFRWMSVTLDLDTALQDDVKLGGFGAGSINDVIFEERYPERALQFEQLLQIFHELGIRSRHRLPPQIAARAIPLTSCGLPQRRDPESQYE